MHRSLSLATAFALGIAMPGQAAADDQPSKEDAAAAAASSPARFDKDLGLKGWDIPFPSFGDTLLQDVGGFRTTLAKYGIGVLDWNLIIMSVNMLNTPRQSNGIQTYWGQRFSVFAGTIAYVTVDMGHYGIPGGQFQISGQFDRSSWQPFIPSSFALNGLSYYQSLFDSKLELIVGYVVNNTSFVGTALGSNLASPFGPSASIPAELGLSFPPATAPTAEVKINIGSFYNQAAVQRSLPPASNHVLASVQLNPTGFKLKVDNAKALVIDEVGYKHLATPERSYLWARLGAMYNNSPFADFSQSGKTADNFGSYLLVDRQIWRLAPSASETAYRGLYLGVSAEYAAPKTNVVSQYYEARAYVLGPFHSRPKDQIGLVYFHQVFSRYLRDASERSGLLARSWSNTITPSYTLRILSGLYGTVSVSFTDHPSFVYVPNEDSALLFQASLYIAL